MLRRNAMIRAFKESDLSEVMQIWFDANVKAHNFIPKKYWLDNYAAVKEILPKAEVYVYEDDYQHLIMGFNWKLCCWNFCKRICTVKRCRKTFIRLC